MPKRKKRIVTAKKKKFEDVEEPGEEEDTVSSAKKVAVSSTSYSEDDASQNACFNSIGTSEGSLGFSSHFWCNYCEFSADTKQELVTHMRQHMIKCSFCAFSSLSRAEVLRHTKGEHGDEEEVDSSSSTADHDMDKDPCCACIFCDFMTYSTEYLEKHTASKHLGMLPKSVAKMISKSVSAKVRKADALFYSTLANEEAEANVKLDKEAEPSKFELPSSSNAIIIEEERGNCSDVKPQVSTIANLLSSHDAPSPLLPGGVKLNPGDEEQIEKIASEISQTLSVKSSTDWKVKVETMYCLSCPYSNVAIDKLKCHTFSQHPTDAAVTKNNSGDAGHDLLDVMFFCVKDTCNHSTNASGVYEDHIMNCCPLHQPLSEDVRERLRSTLKFLSNFHSKHGLKTAPGFIDFVSSFEKVNPPPEASRTAKFPSSSSTENTSDSHSLNDNSRTTTQNVQPIVMKNDFSTQHNDQPVPESQHFSNVSMASNFSTPSSQSHAIPSVFNQQTTQLDLSGEIDRKVPPFGHPSQGNSNAHILGESSLLYQSSGAPPSASFQSSHTPSLSQQQKPVYSQPFTNDGIKNNIPPAPFQFPPVHPDCRNPGQNCFTTTSDNSQRVHPGPPTGVNIYNPNQGQQPHVSEYGSSTVSHAQNSSRILAPNTSSFVPNQSTQSSSTAPPMLNTTPFISNSCDQKLTVQANAPFTSSLSSPVVSTSLLSQQLNGSVANQSIDTSTAPALPNPPKMLDLLSDSYSILLDDDLDLTSSLDGQITGTIPQQSSLSNTHGGVNAGMPGPCSFPQVSMQQSAAPFMQVSYPQQSSISHSSTAHPQQSTAQGTVSHQSITQNLLSYQSSTSNSHATVPGPMAAPLSHTSMPIQPSHDFNSHTATSFPNASMSTYTNVQQADATGVQQSFTNESQYPPLSSSQFPFHPALPGPIDVSSPTQGANVETPVPLQQSVPFVSSQTLAASSALVPNAIPQSKQMDNSGQILNPKVDSSESSSSSFFETPSSITEPMQSLEENQATDVPNFLVPTSQNDQAQMDMNQPDQNSLANQNAQSILSGPPGQSGPSTFSHVTPVKNQPMNAARNVAGNSPLSPSIYLNGQAPRHSRTSWTSTDLMPRGAALPQIRARAPAPTNYPNPSNVRQNLFPPHHYRARGRPRGPRMQNRPMHPGSRPHDDDVIVTAVVRGAPSQQPIRPALRRGMMRGPRQPMPRGPTRGTVRNPLGASVPPHSKKPFDVSNHFVDLACVVNTGNDEDNGGGDDIQIMGVTPGHSANKGPPKAVDAKKFSFCCVHCGQDQGSKQVMKQHMKASHNDSLLGAFRNVETGQLLFFCPQLRCEFMSYDENRLTEHLFSCYNLDKSKQFPFDLQSALKNLRSLKIRRVSTNVTVGRSQTNPIDLDGKGLRDTFNNNLTDAFDDMVENTVGRQMIRPNGSSTQQAPTPGSAPSYPEVRPPGHSRPPQRGRPISNGARIPRHPFQPRHPQMMPNAPGQQGNPRIPPYQQSQRGPGRRNFRQYPHGGPTRSMRDLSMRMSRPSMRGRPLNPQPFVPVPTLGNEGEPILIDIDPEGTELTSQNSLILANNHAEFVSSAEAATISPEVAAVSTVDHTIMSTSLQTVTNQSNVSLDSSLCSSTNQDIEAGTPSEASSSMPSQRPETVDDSSSQNVSPYVEAEESQSQLIENTTPQAVPLHPTIAQDSHVDSQFGPQAVPHSINLDDEFPPVESNEEQVQAILLDKVFAKVPHMPKKLSQRLVLRFKEFAAKRGVVITPNSKVIDEFVERISYKGSNPLSKQHPSQQQHQQPHQQQQQPQQQQQQQSQPLQQQPYYPAIPESSYKSSQSTTSLSHHSHSHLPISATTPGNDDSSLCATDDVTPTTIVSHHQQFSELNLSQHQNISNPLSRHESERSTSQYFHEPNTSAQHFHEPNASQHFNEPSATQHLNESNASEHFHEPNTFQHFNVPNTSQHFDEASPTQHLNGPNASEHFNDPNTSQYQRGPDLAQRQSFQDSYHQNHSSVSQYQNQPIISLNQSLSNGLRGQRQVGFSQNENMSNSLQDQNQGPFFQNQTNPNQHTADDEISEAVDKDTDDCDIIETKIILAERDLKFSGAFANIAKSVVDHSNKSVKQEGSWSPSTLPDTFTTNAVTSISYSHSGPGLKESCPSVSSVPLSHSQKIINPLTDPLMSLSEQVTLNEKLLKKEPIPMTFPMSKEGEAILVQSSVDHLVSGNESLEVDIAGTPLYANPAFPHDAKIESMKNADGLCNVGGAVKQVKLKIHKDKDKELIIDKASGKIVLKVKKGILPRKPNDPLTNVVPKREEKETDQETFEEQCIRRSERKRKVRQSDREEDATTELDNLLSDDDDDYHIESDDESYDEGEYEKGHGNKKKSKVPEDPNAFNIKQKGLYLCWICFKKLASCLGAKRHIHRKHSTAFCAIIQEEAGSDDAGQTPLQLLLFCPRNCRYATLKPDAFAQHMAACQKSEIVCDSDSQSLVEAQTSFVTQEYAELQTDVSSGALLEKMKQKSGPVKRKRQSTSNRLSTEKLLEAGYFTEVTSPEQTVNMQLPCQPNQGPM